MTPPLHVTNGDAAVAALQAAGIHGTFLPWRDVLHDGPVPAVGWDELAAVRAQFIAQRGWASEAEATASFQARDATFLGALRADPRIVLWFEHDLYDQLQLAQVLAMAAESVRRGRELFLAQSDDYLTSLTPTALSALHAAARPVTRQALHEAVSAWQAFTAATPDVLRRLAEGEDDPGGESGDGPGDADAALPYLRPALRRLLEEYPNAVTGLSRTELQALRVLSSGARDPRVLYAAAHHAAESPVWLGDSAFVGILHGLCAGPRPLVACVADRCTLTADGEAVLRGEVHRSTLQPIDRWIGGVHIVA